MKVWLFIFFFAFSVGAQDKDSQLQKELDRMREMMEQMLGKPGELDEFFNNFHKKFFDDPFFNQQQWPPEFHDFLKRMDPAYDWHAGGGKIYWKVTPLLKTLVVEIESPKESPLKVEIKAGHIEISGQAVIKQQVKKQGVTQEVVSVQKFKDVRPIPKDVDADQPQIKPLKNNKGLEIIFKRLGTNKKNPPPKNRMPIEVDEHEYTI